MASIQVSIHKSYNFLVLQLTKIYLIISNIIINITLNGRRRNKTTGVHNCGQIVLLGNVKKNSKKKKQGQKIV